MAMSVPVPMAMPTSASASAGASLMPSPTKATLPSACAQPLHRVDLAVGQHLGDHLVDAEPPGDRLGGPAVVAGDHRDLEAERMQRRDRLRRRRLDRVGDGDDGGEPAVDGGIERALALGRRDAAAARESGDTSSPSFVMKRSAPTSTLRPSTRAETPKPGTASKLSVDGKRQAALLGRRDDGLARSDARSGLSTAATSAQHLGFREALGGDEVGQLRPALGQGAGLVEGDDVDVAAGSAAPRPCGTARRAPPRGRCRP